MGRVGSPWAGVGLHCHTVPEWVIFWLYFKFRHNDRNWIVSTNLIEKSSEKYTSDINVLKKFHQNNLLFSKLKLVPAELHVVRVTTLFDFFADAKISLKNRLLQNLYPVEINLKS